MARHDDSYEHLRPLLVEHATMDSNDPARGRVREQLVVGYMPVARNIARRFAGRGSSVDDLEQVAAIGLLSALNRYEPERGRDFLSYAVPTMMGEVRRYFRDSTWVVRTPRSIKDRYLTVTAATGRLARQLNRAPDIGELAAELSLTRDEVAEAVAAHGSLQPSSLDDTRTGRVDDFALADVLGEHDPGLDRAEARSMVRDLVARVPSRERTILALRFVYDRTQSEIAAELGISQMHVSRLLHRTLGQLREHIEAQLPEPGEATRPRSSLRLDGDGSDATCGDGTFLRAGEDLDKQAHPCSATAPTDRSTHARLSPTGQPVHRVPRRPRVR